MQQPLRLISDPSQCYFQVFVSKFPEFLLKGMASPQMNFKCSSPLEMLKWILKQIPLTMVAKLLLSWDSNQNVVLPCSYLLLKCCVFFSPEVS